MWRTDGGTIASEGVGNGLWFTLQWAIDSMDADGSLIFDRTGGTQGSEGFAGGGPFYIEGTFKFMHFVVVSKKKKHAKERKRERERECVCVCV
jgi:hypothetical protein